MIVIDTHTSFLTWLDTFVTEKEIDTERVLSVTGPVWGENLIPVEVVLEHIRIASPAEQLKIKDTLVEIDFRNGDVIDYLTHLARAIAY